MKDKVCTFVFIGILAVFGIGYIVTPQREFSEMENRYLTKRPTFNIEQYISGKYAEEFEEYSGDQILGKDMLVKTNTAVNYCLGQRQHKGVYIGKEQYLIQEYREPGTVFSDNLRFIEEFAKDCDQVEVSMLLIPNVAGIYPEYMPYIAKNYNQDMVADKVVQELGDTIEIYEAAPLLKLHKEEYIYYKTDHHFTSLGAYYGYVALCQGLGIEPTPWENFDTYNLSNAFYGTQYSKVPLYHQEGDQITLAYNAKKSYRVEYVQEGKVTDSMFDLSYEGKKDQYAVFFGGNYPLVHITSPEGREEKVLVIKDSYANSLVPMLANEYRDLYMMDLRYYHQDVNQFVQEQGIKQVIFIHNIEFLSTDNNFLWL